MELSLSPIGEPPNRSARWCPRCCAWIERLVLRGRRRCHCGAAVVRQGFRATAREGELRPGIVAEFRDPRDWHDPRFDLAALRARLTGDAPPPRV